MSNSSSSPGFPPPSIEYGIAASTFNAAMFNALLLGLYSMIYVYTMYIYLSRKGISKGNMAIVATITALYLVNVALTAATWVSTREGFLGTVGQPIEAVFLAFFSGSNWDVLLNDFGTLLFISLADGLLIWRCYHVWGQSLYPVIFPIAFLLAEMALNLSVIIIACINNLSPPPNVAVTLDHLSSAAVFMTLASTLLTTSLIAYRIYSVSQGSKANLKRRSPFVAIIDAIVQSAAAYTIVSLLFAIEGVVPFTFSTGPTLFNLQGYTFPLFSITAGAAPTVMVARVALAGQYPQDAVIRRQMTDLEFNGALSSATFPNPSSATRGGLAST